jgi:vitamin B12/bleomycin/antimicrobial peptide transport system ATP-binding/permease protein
MRKIKIEDATKMILLAALPAVVAGLALITGISGGEKLLLGLGAIGLLVAYVAWQAPRLSPFLRVFIYLFALEFAVTGAAHLLGKTGYWPQAFEAIKIPFELPLTVGFFAILVYAISFIPVVRTITSLADPYFASENNKVSQLPILGAVQERSLAWGLTTALIVINQLQVGISVRLSFWGRDIFNSLQTKDQTTFWHLITVVFAIWATLFVLSNLMEYFLENILKIRWRDYIVERTSGKWLNNGAHYRMGFNGATDNPDQRIAEDVRSYINYTYTFSLSLISTLSNLVSFSLILWSIPVQFTIPFTSIIVPGLPFWCALIYSILGTLVTHWLGRPLIGLDFNQEKREADFRYGLARMREYTEQVALLKGEGAERQFNKQRFSAIVSNYYAIMKQNMKLNTFVWYYYNASTVVPYILMAPAVFADKVKIGEFTQVAGAFNRVEGSMQWFIVRYQTLAAYKAVVDRLTTFGEAINKANALKDTSGINLPSKPSQDLSIPALALNIPNGETIVNIKDLTFKQGETVLVTGPSGSGKSTMFRAIAGIWPFGQGDIHVPDGKSVMLLPQRPYLPMGTLREAVQYPGLSGDHADAQMNAALAVAKLPKLVGRLDEDANWSQVLSLGEQQRLAIARALITKPDWLFLDEATAALDEPTEAAIYDVLKDNLKYTTIISIGHRSTLIPLHKRRIDLKAGADGVFAVSDVKAKAVKA